MMVDIIFILLIIISFIIGYFKGFYKELYSIINVILSILLTFLFKNQFINHIKTFFNKIDIIEQYLIPLVGTLLLYIVFSIIFYILIRKLIKSDRLPNDKDTLKPIGGFLSFLKVIFLLTFISAFLSFTTLVPEFNIYDKSYLAPFILKLNPPLYKITNNTKILYKDAIDTAKILSDLDKIDELSIDDRDTIIRLMKSDLVTEPLMISVLDVFMENIKKEQELKDKEISEVIKENKGFSILKELYMEDIITDEMLIESMKENDLKDIDYNEIMDIFKE